MLVEEDDEGGESIDFGLANPKRGESSGTLTVGGGFVGTPHFASPEQLERDIDIRSDIYSLGPLVTCATLTPDRSRKS